eukprot:TRINITY_DN14826_c0_g1_i2.p2 TRINITY_DN14826_c0_g1~~TRINITY_DN14826_c0_g1_i2.p2  ORF type:complete len:181 (+),score=21.02 TRINITY_DN14826_c0_g1_i2:130-672(+)
MKNQESNNHYRSTKFASNVKTCSAVGRRGGYGDGGGVTDDGSVPKAKVKHTKSDAELNSELSRALNQLDPKQEWNVRVSALVSLEGLFLGGACQAGCFQNHQRKLRELLVVQINDRRSAVSSQACQVIETMVQELGQKFDVFALYLYPVLIKILVITVQVVAESGDKCLTARITSSQSHK